MGMSSGGNKRGPQSDINMTPMIDILLVLLIIFMVVQQSMQEGVSVTVPPMPKKDQPPPPPNANPDQIVLEVKAGPAYFLNQQPIPVADLQSRLTEVFGPRPRKVIFIKGDENVPYGEVVKAVDVSRASGIDVVGIVPRPAAKVAAPGS